MPTVSGMFAAGVTRKLEPNTIHLKNTNFLILVYIIFKVLYLNFIIKKINTNQLNLIERIHLLEPTQVNFLQNLLLYLLFFLIILLTKKL